MEKQLEKEVVGRQKGNVQVDGCVIEGSLVQKKNVVVGSRQKGNVQVDGCVIEGSLQKKNVVVGSKQKGNVQVDGCVIEGSLVQKKNVTVGSKQKGNVHANKYTMEDPLQKRLERVKRLSGSIGRRASLYSEITQIGNDRATQTFGSLQKAPAPGKKLQKIGFMMLWIPEPTGATCAIGGPMILAGRYLEKKYNSATIHDIGHETKSTVSAIRDFKNTIM